MPDLTTSIDAIQTDLSDESTLHYVEVDKVGYYTSSTVKTATMPAKDSSAEVQSNKLASADESQTDKTAIYKNKTSDVKYPTAKAVWEYVQSLL